MISIEEARALILAEARPLPSESRALSDVLGAVLAQTIHAPHDVPPFDNSAMDGFAVLAADTRGATADSPVELAVGETIPAGHSAEAALRSGQAYKIMTGAPMPPGADAVVQVEDTEPGVADAAGERVRVVRAATSGLNVRRAGEDVAAGMRVLSPGAVLQVGEIGALASLGYPHVDVHRRPRVAILSTGSELVEVDQPLGPGQIRNSNSYTLEAQCRALGIVAERLGIAPDDYESTRRMVERGLQYDVLISSGGVSVGEFDFVKDVQDALGVERRLWKVAMKPGKPLAFGVHGDTLVFGVPGNPVASMVSFELFIRPALLRLMGHERVLRPLHKAVLQEDLPNRHGRVHVVRVRAWREGETWHVSSTGPQGSAMIRSMIAADGLIFVPARDDGLKAGDRADLLLLREEAVAP